VYTVETVPGELGAVRVSDAAGGSAIEVVPARGGIVSAFRANHRDVLFLDAATLHDRAKNVRGGIPVLFPIAGKLAGDEYARDGVRRGMKQHGFARNLPWRLLAAQGGARGEVALALASDDATRAAFPWDFELTFRYVLEGATLTVAQEYRNTGAHPMPLHAGFHPYFFVPDASKARATISTDATRAMDNRTGATGAFTGFDLTQPEVDLHLLDHRARTTRLALGDGRAVTLRMDAAFKTLVVWTLTGRDFVCVEPWTAPGNALNTGEGLVEVAPGAAFACAFSITAEG
jgi:galactose mutarotase-like enzyme